MIKKVLHLLLFSCLFLASTLAFSQGDFIVEKSYVEDPQKSLSIDQIYQQNFQTFSGIFNRGYGKTSYWFKLKIQAEKIDQSVLRILPTFLDRIEVYIPQKNGTWLIKKTGDQFAFNDRDYNYTSFAISLKQIDRNNPTIYVRLITESSNFIAFEVIDEKSLTTAEGQRDMALGAYLGLLFVFIIWSIFTSLKHKNIAILAFGCFELAEIAYAFALMGYLSRFVLADQPLLADFITSFTVINHIFFGCLFHTIFLHSIRLEGWAPKIQWGFTGLYIALQILFLCGFKQHAIIWTNYLVLPMSLNMLFTAYAVHQQKSPLHRGMSAVYLFLFVSVILAITPYLGLVHAVEASLYASLFTGFASSILLFVLLHRQEQLIQKQLSGALYEAQHEKEQHQQQSRLMAMLTHEIKTPLSTLRLTVGSLIPSGKILNQAEEAIKDIDQIIERCRQADQLEQKQMIPKIEIIHVSDLLKMIAKYSNDYVQTQCELLEAAPIVTDRLICEIVLSNLIENAKKYAPAKSTITISIKDHPINSGDGLLISISNQVGKAGAPQLDTLFNKYHREPGAHNISGSGLGLFIVKSCVDILGGKIEYRHHSSTVEFHVWLP